MFALFTTASLLLSGFFWGSALLTSGAALDPRTAALIFGWLCIASIAVGVFALSRGSDYDQLSPAFAGALATTLLTGAAILYVAYFEWQPAMAFAAAQAAPVMQRLPEQPLAKEAAQNVAALPRAAPSRPKARPALAKVVEACSAFKGVEKQQCRRCGNESGISGFVCRENARAEYCAGRDGSEPGCPLVRSAAAD
jgi:hypothetical protein